MVSLKIGVQMDKPERLNFASDTTIALIESAQNRNHQVFVFHPDTLCLAGRQVTALSSKIILTKNSHELSNAHRVDLNIFDVILIRQEPPFDLDYITTTYILEKLNKKLLCVNSPNGIRNCPEKILVTNFPDLMPPTIISKDLAVIKDFHKEHGDIVIKPLYGFAGKSVLRLSKKDENFDAIMEMFFSLQKEALVVQKFISDVYNGDKRVFLIDGKFVGGINRVPGQNQFRSNIIAGGTPLLLTPDDEEKIRKICDIIGDTLRKHELYFCGIDVIGSYITEINVTCPTGIRQYQHLSGINLADLYWQGIEKKVSFIKSVTRSK